MSPVKEKRQMTWRATGSRSSEETNKVTDLRKWVLRWASGNLKSRKEANKPPGRMAATGWEQGSLLSLQLKGRGLGIFWILVNVSWKASFPGRCGSLFGNG